MRKFKNIYISELNKDDEVNYDTPYIEEVISAPLMPLKASDTNQYVSCSSSLYFMADSMFTSYIGYTRDYNDYVCFVFDNLSNALEHYYHYETPILIVDRSNKDNIKPIYMLVPKYFYNCKNKVSKDDFYSFQLVHGISELNKIVDPHYLMDLEDYDGESSAFLVKNIIDLDLLVNSNSNLEFVFYKEEDDPDI